ncbi:MAG TPA: phosphatase PAP2 family protein [Stenotrophomonas sp.]|nr:phosphatase PAP2 family protein [Stenotrophomonas sp.]
MVGGGGDFWFADLLYRLEGGHWALRDAWFTSHLIHRTGRWLTFVGVAWVLIATIRAWRAPANPHRRAWLALLLSLGLSTGLVSLFKHLTHMDCPWDLTRYGGGRMFFGLLESRHGIPSSGCFPAGHAGSGYAWVALYFFALAVDPRWRWPALALGLGTGLVFGFSQQLRGAHFLSHDLWALALCWVVPLCLFRLLADKAVRA